MTYHSFLGQNLPFVRLHAVLVWSGASSSCVFVFLLLGSWQIFVVWIYSCWLYTLPFLIKNSSRKYADDILVELYASQDKCFKFFLSQVAQRESRSGRFLCYTDCFRLLLRLYDFAFIFFSLNLFASLVWNAENCSRCTR